jgi:hypothetical protein
VSAEDTCAVCGRTILAGERVQGYFTADGRRGVCELCVGRAERLGWRREGDVEEPAAAAGKRRRTGIAALWRRRARRVQPEDPTPSPRPSPDPAAPGMRAERPQPGPSPLSPFERAASRFNASEAGRTVAGLVRTLGAPWVSVGASAGAANEVRITVAWELSWYQWGVDLGDELRPVFQIDKGNEIDQLDSAARQWNASAVAGGRVVLVAPSKDAAGAPAHR